MTVFRRFAVAASLMAIISLIVPGTAQAGLRGPVRPAAARWVEVTFTSNINLPLDRVDYGLMHGKWNIVPPPVVNRGALWGSESKGFLTGTEGYATYRVPGYPQEALVIYWDNPFVGSNSFTCDPPGKLLCDVTVHGGPRVTYHLY